MAATWTPTSRRRGSEVNDTNVGMACLQKIHPGLKYMTREGYWTSAGEMDIVDMSTLLLPDNWEVSDMVFFLC